MTDTTTIPNLLATIETNATGLNGSTSAQIVFSTNGSFQIHVMWIDPDIYPATGDDTCRISVDHGRVPTVIARGLPDDNLEQLAGDLIDFLAGPVAAS